MLRYENKYFIYDRPRKINLKYIMRYCFVKLVNIYYRFALNLCKPVIEKKKYNISICAIFKNEGAYLKEWIEFHKIVGVDHFYLYNNNSEDKYNQILTPYIKEGTVSLIEWPYAQGQMSAYRNCIENYKNDTNWIGFIDLDEFVVPKREDNIADFLKRFEKRPVVKLYWQIFGTSGLVNRDKSSLVTESFFACWTKYDEVGKCFYNTAYDYDPSFKWNRGFFHGMWCEHNGITLPPVNCFDKICQRGFESVESKDFPIQINHYYTKSFDEYVEKASRGDAFFKENPRNFDFFYRHEKKCGATDYSIYKYLIKLKLVMGDRRE